MKHLILLVFASVVVSVFCKPAVSKATSPTSTAFRFVRRAEWGARAAISYTTLETPVKNVIIHHTHIPVACYTFAACSRAMRSIQNTHQLTNGWDDIGYNFAVGSDGAVYEGRGWQKVGAHTTGHNSNSIGIVLIGDWVSVVPPANQLRAARNLIAHGVKLGHINRNHNVFGHRDFSATECPGTALYNVIKNW